MSRVYRAGTITDPIEAGEEGACAIGAPGRSVLNHKDPGGLTRRTIADPEALKDFAWFDGARPTCYTAMGGGEGPSGGRSPQKAPHKMGDT
jgi:hypothetical protein